MLMHDVTRRERSSLERNALHVLDAICRNGDIGVCIANSQGVVVSVNRGFLRICGYAERDVVGRNFADLVLPPVERERANRLHRAFLAGDAEESTDEWNVRRKDGTDLVVSVTASRLVLEDGERFTVTSIVDVTDQRREREALALQTERLWNSDRETNRFRERLRVAQQAAGLGLFDYDVPSGRIEADAAFLALHGFSDAEGARLSYQTWRRSLFPADIALVEARLWRTLETGADFRHRFRIRRPGGEIRVLQTAAAVSEWLAGAPKRLTGVSYDVTEEEATREALARIAFVDRLTGLPNRFAAMERLASESKAPAGPDRIAVAVVDIHQLRRINRRSGERVGDAVLRHVSAILAATFPGFVARTGGDSFVLHGRFPTEAAAEEAVLAARAAAGVPCSVEGLSIPIALHVGYVLRLQGDGPDVLANAFDDAILALEEAKQGTVEGGAFRFVPEIRARAEEERFLLEALEQAIPRGELDVHYQPQVDMETGRVCGVEALLRWTLPGHGAIRPDVIIPLAEQSGAILEIGEFVAERLARDAAGWSAAGLDVQSASINVSPVQIADPGFLAFAGRLSQRMAAIAQAPKLHFELTETDYIQPSPDNISKLQAVRRLGFGISIDDFGKGYSSLGYLEDFPVDTIKIDRALVSRIERSHYARRIIQSVSEIAEAIGARLIAEGVETEGQARTVRACGCALGQGYLFSAPIAADAVPEAVRGLGSPPAAV